MVTKPNMVTKYIMEVNIDFDAASKAWMENKRKIPNGCYEYRCIAITKKGTGCKNKPMKDQKYCKVHCLHKNPVFTQRIG